MVGAASVAEGYTCKATPTSPPPPILVVHTLAIQLVELHLRNDHTPSPALTKRQAHNLSDMVRIVLFFFVLSIYDVLLWQVRVQKASYKPFSAFCWVFNTPPQDGVVVLYIRSLIPLMGDRYAQRRRKTPAKPLRCVTVHVRHVVNA